MFLFLDESGDLGFDWSKKCSAHFTITILLCDDIKTVDAIKLAVKRTIRRKLNVKNKSKILELKGTNSTAQVKKFFYQQMPKNGWCLYSVTLNKKRVYENLQSKAGKKKLYNFLANHLLKKIPLDDLGNGSVQLIVDRCKNSAEMQDFNLYIENQLEAMLGLETKLYIHHQSSQENFALQAVDLFCWGIARKYKGDVEWYSTFKNKIKYEELYLR